VSITLKQIETFVQVADLGSFRAAAERLNTTQPNISNRIAGLETALGAQLMERDAGSVRLTLKGRQLLDHARQVLGATEALIEASGQTALFTGALRLGVTEMIAHTWLRDFLRAFRRAYPNISVELTVDLSATLETELFARTIDIAFQNGPFTRQASGTQLIGAYPPVWVASPALNLTAPISAQDMAAHPILTHARGTRQHTEVVDHFRAHEVSGLRIVPSSNLAVGAQMAANGMGIAALPRAMVRAEIDRGELTEVPYGWLPSALEFAARFDATTSPAHVRLAADIAGEVAGASALKG
jgi:DNA-binding transcriptional LysR family regulator